jgi:ATP-binding cassette, subfamily F, member 3
VRGHRIHSFEAVAPRTLLTTCPGSEGGWQRRLALACGLFVRPDILLLDEPTNHLDLHGILWLERFLSEVSSLGSRKVLPAMYAHMSRCQEFEGTVILVSHDRSLMDTVCTDIVHFYKRQLTYYPGNFSDFDRIKSEQDLHMSRVEDSIVTKRKHIEESIKK